MSLFHDPIPIDLPEADITYFPQFFTQKEADKLYSELLENTAWQQDDIKVFGKIYQQPRLTALYGNNGKAYRYSNITMFPNAFSPVLEMIKYKIENTVDHVFTTCLLNLYRNGMDSNGWHADNEPELGTNPVIASISLGANRYFHLKHREDKNLKNKILLEHGSLLLMKGETQHRWLHQIPKTKKSIGERINLTFRTIA